MWKRRQVDVDNIAYWFITTVEQNQKKKGTKELNALLARLKTLVFAGNSFFE